MKIKLENESMFELSDNSTVLDLAHQLKLTGPDKALGARINGKNYDMSHILKKGDDVHIINFDTSEGKEIFWHTSAHILAQAVLRLWPDAQPTIGPPIESGFYYDFANLVISDNDFEKIEKEMQSIINSNFSTHRKKFNTKAEALKAFNHNKYKCELIESFAEDDEITAYEQGEFFDLCRGPHLPKLGKIKAVNP